jgi:hypothetical protein
MQRGMQAAMRHRMHEGDIGAVGVVLCGNKV